MPARSPAITPLKQLYSWDCGVTCYLMTRACLGLPPISHEQACALLKASESEGTATRDYERALQALSPDNSNIETQFGADREWSDVTALLEQGWIITVCFIPPNDDAGHYALVQALDDEAIVLADPDGGKLTRLALREFQWRTGIETPPRVRWCAAARNKRS